MSGRTICQWIGVVISRYVRELFVPLLLLEAFGA